MAKAGGRNNHGDILQKYIIERAEDYGIAIRETAGSGNCFSSDSDIQNGLLQIEAKQKTSKDGISMPSKSDWKKLVSESSNTGRFPILCSCGSNKPNNSNTIVALKLDHLLLLMQGEHNEF